MQLLYDPTPKSNGESHNNELRTEKWEKNQQEGNTLPHLRHKGQFYHKGIRHEKLAITR